MYTFCDKKTGQILGTTNREGSAGKQYHYFLGSFNGDTHRYDLNTGEVVAIDRPYPELGVIKESDLRNYLDDDVMLDKAIANLLRDSSPERIASFRKERYVVLRKWRYPKMEDYLDAQVKKASMDKEIQKEGIEQERLYLLQCKGIKKRFPSK